MENNETLPLEQPRSQVMTTPQAQPAVMSSADRFMNVIAQLATDTSADIAKFERLVALRNDELAREAKLAFDHDYADMKPNLPLVIKKHDNDQTSSKYAKLEDVNQAIDPVLGKYGFGTSSKVIKQTPADVTMLLILRHRSGHYDQMELTMPIDNEGAKGNVNKTKVHGISSTISYIKRVGFCALLNISTGDDKDGNAPPKDKQGEPISVEWAAALDMRLRAISDKALPNFLKWAKVESITDITQRDYSKAVKAVKDMEQQAAAAKAKS